jgi:hypothetical protein
MALFFTILDECDGLGRLSAALSAQLSQGNERAINRFCSRPAPNPPDRFITAQGWLNLWPLSCDEFFGVRRAGMSENDITRLFALGLGIIFACSLMLNAFAY